MNKISAPPFKHHFHFSKVRKTLTESDFVQFESNSKRHIKLIDQRLKVYAINAAWSEFSEVKLFNSMFSSSCGFPLDNLFIKFLSSSYFCYNQATKEFNWLEDEAWQASHQNAVIKSPAAWFHPNVGQSFLFPHTSFPQPSHSICFARDSDIFQRCFQSLFLLNGWTSIISSFFDSYNGNNWFLCRSVSMEGK